MSTEQSAPQRPSSWLSNAFALVGVFLFLGGLALFITQLREGIAAPPAPIETTYAALPEHVRAGATWVTGFAPQRAALARADAVVSHAGLNTALDALVRDAKQAQSSAA